MSTRKLILFGKNSYIISLPKEWTERNKLSKGSDVNVDEQFGNIIISPAGREIQQELRIKKINCDEAPRKVGREIIAAYINNYNMIEVSGQTIKNHIKEIEEVTHSLVALEIMEQTPKKVIIKDFLNTQDISMENIIKRMDIIIRAMLTEVQESFDNSEKLDLDKRDIDVNRLFYVGQKLLNKLLDNPQMSKNLNMHIQDSVFYWQILDSLEKIADQQKRIVRNINVLGKDCAPVKPIKELFELLIKEYLSVIKALHNMDHVEADGVLSRKEDILTRCDEIVDKYMNKCKSTKEVHNTTEAVEKFKRFENYNTQIAKAIINKD